MKIFSLFSKSYSNNFDIIGSKDSGLYDVVSWGGLPGPYEIKQMFCKYVFIKNMWCIVFNNNTVTCSKTATSVYNRIRDTVGNNCKLVHNRIRDTVAPFLVIVTIGLYRYCDVFYRRPSLLCNTLIVTRYPQYFHGYAHHSGILALHGNQQLDASVSIVAGNVKEGKTIHASQSTSVGLRSESSQRRRCSAVSPVEFKKP
jgi:hypothetical protein